MAGMASRRRMAAPARVAQVILEAFVRHVASVGRARRPMIQREGPFGPSGT
jgi:hypothetical protein